MEWIRKRPIIMLVVGVLGISMSAIFVRYAQSPSVLTATYRLIWTVLLMSPMVFGKKKIRNELLQVEGKMLMLSVLSGVLLAVHFVTWFESLLHTSVASSAIIVCTEVIWVALGFRYFLKGKLTKKAVLAIVISLLGSVLIAWTDSSAGGNAFYGDVLALIAAVAVAGYTLLGRVVRGSMGNTVYTYIVYVSAAVTLVIMTLAQGIPFFGYGTSGILSGFLLAVFCTILGHSVFSWCLKYFSPAFVSASKLCEPVISSLFAAFLFQEIPVLLQVVGGVIVLAGVVYYSLQEAGKNG